MSLVQKKHPLRTLTGNRNWQLGYGSLSVRPTSDKRKSAVEMLQETKAFYVKSERVLDSKQQMKHADHLHISPTQRAVAPPLWHRRSAEPPPQVLLAPPPPPAPAQPPSAAAVSLSPPLTPERPPPLPPRSPGIRTKGQPKTPTDSSSGSRHTPDRGRRTSSSGGCRDRRRSGEDVQAQLRRLLTPPCLLSQSSSPPPSKTAIMPCGCHKSLPDISVGLAQDEDDVDDGLEMSRERRLVRRRRRRRRRQGTGDHSGTEDSSATSASMLAQRSRSEACRSGNGGEAVASDYFMGHSSPPLHQFYQLQHPYQQLQPYPAFTQPQPLRPVTRSKSDIGGGHHRRFTGAAAANEDGSFGWYTAMSPPHLSLRRGSCDLLDGPQEQVDIHDTHYLPYHQTHQIHNGQLPPPHTRSRRRQLERFFETLGMEEFPKKQQTSYSPSGGGGSPCQSSVQLWERLSAGGGGGGSSSRGRRPSLISDSSSSPPQHLTSFAQNSPQQQLVQPQWPTIPTVLTAQQLAPAAVEPSVVEKNARIVKWLVGCRKSLQGAEIGPL